MSASGGTTPYSYTWSPNGGNDSSATNLAPDNYVVAVTDNAGCTNQVQITISAPDEIIVADSIMNANCGQDNGEIKLAVTGGTGNYTYSWSPNVSTSDQATNLAVGNYTVTITDGSDCSKTVSYTVNEGNAFYINTSPKNTTITQGESVDLHVFVDPNVAVDSIIWVPSKGLSCNNCTDPNAYPSETTIYIVTVIDTNGCSSKDTVKINVITPCGDIFVPNSFSPNSDGINDLQCVLGDCIVSLDFSIYNRWGETVFHSTNQKDCWNGIYRGKRVQTGIYVYKLKATLTDGKEVEKTGNITVTR